MKSTFSVSATRSLLDRRGSFFCPVLNAKLVVDCECRSCPLFGLSYSWHCVRSVNAPLAEEQIATHLNVPKAEVIERKTSALAMLRRLVLQEDIAKPEQGYERISRSSCANCGSLNLSEALAEGNYIYCSNNCVLARPPQVIEIEVETGKDLKSLVQATLERHGSEDTAEIFGLTLEQLRLALLHRYNVSVVRQLLPQEVPAKLRRQNRLSPPKILLSRLRYKETATDSKLLDELKSL